MKDSFKLLIVDDSAITRKIISSFFEGDRHVRVVGEAANGQEALKAIAQLNPDVVTLDVNMPVMNGLVTLKHMMIQSPKPTVMFSSLTREGASITFDALRYGAVDFIVKPNEEDDFEALCGEIKWKVNVAAKVSVQSIQYIPARLQNKPTQHYEKQACERMVVMGAAEGGYSALLKIIPRLRPDPSVAYLVVLYVASQYIEAFVHYLNQYSVLRVKRAVNGQPLESGTCYLGSGEEYTTLHTREGQLVLHVNPAPFASRRGSIDMMMFSVSDLLGDQAIGVVLSGSGDDGGEGLEEVMRMGGKAIVQSPESCLHKDMAVFALNRCQPDYLVSDLEVAEVINRLH